MLSYRNFRAEFEREVLNIIIKKTRSFTFNDIYKELRKLCDNSIPDDYTGEYRSKYKEIMTNQYKNMEYKIINESIEGNEAVVDAEITVYDYSSVMNNASEYLKDHIEEFKKDAQELTDEITDNDYDQDKYNEYRLKKLEEATDKINYTIEFNLTKKDKKWVIEPLSDSDIQKLHGLYEE